MGLLEGDSDILFGQLAGEPENGFPTIDFLPFSNAISFDIHLVESGDEANFLWNPTSEDIDFLLVRTVFPQNEFSGNLMSITLSTIDYPLSYDTDPGEGITPEVSFTGNDSDWPDLTSGDSIPSSLIWNFNDYTGADPERRLLNSILLAGDIDDGGDEMVVGVAKLGDDEKYNILVLSSTVPTDEVLAGEDPDFDLLGIWKRSSLEGEYNFTKRRDSDEYLYIIIQNWSKSELTLDNEKPEAQFITDNFDRWLIQDEQPQLVKVGNPPSDGKVLGAGLSVVVTPYDYGEDQATDPGPGNDNQYTIDQLDGTFTLYIDEQVYDPIEKVYENEENELLFTWDEEDTPSSSSGCSALGLMPGSLLILLPLIILFKKR